MSHRENLAGRQIQQILLEQQRGYISGLSEILKELLVEKKGPRDLCDGVKFNVLAHIATMKAWYGDIAVRYAERPVRQDLYIPLLLWNHTTTEEFLKSFQYRSAT